MVDKKKGKAGRRSRRGARIDVKKEKKNITEDERETRKGSVLLDGFHITISSKFPLTTRFCLSKQEKKKFSYAEQI